MNRVDRILGISVKTVTLASLSLIGFLGFAPVIAAEPLPLSNVSADHNSLAVGRDLNTGGGNINLGINPEQLPAIIAAATDPLKSSRMSNGRLSTS
jgi:hypothetical protein